MAVILKLKVDVGQGGQGGRLFETEIALWAGCLGRVGSEHEEPVHSHMCKSLCIKYMRFGV